MTWINNKKTNDMALQMWIIEYLKMYKIFNKIMNFIMNALAKWKLELIVDRQTLAEVKIQSVIFQGNSISPFTLVNYRFLQNAKRATNLQNYKKRLIPLYTL